jgi:AraC-like DNA-binding protein
MGKALVRQEQRSCHGLAWGLRVAIDKPRRIGARMQPSSNLVPERIRLEQITLDASEVVDPPTPEYKICLVLQGQARLSWRCDDRWRQHDLHPGMFAPVTAPHQSATLHLSDSQQHLLISISESAFDGVCTPDGLGRLTQNPFSDPFLGLLCRRAWVEMQRGDAIGQAFVDSVESAIVSTLLRAAEGKPRARESRTDAPLSPDRLRAIEQHCKDNLAGRIRVVEMAQLSGLPASKFSSAFKSATGQTPQQYLMSLRAGHAKRMLASSGMPLAEIASVCGFFDQSHMNLTFKRLLGMPPLRYRREAGH